MIRIFALLGCFIVCACQTLHSEQKDSAEPLIGEVTAQQILQNNPIFSANYQAYQPTEGELTAVSLLQGKSLTVLFGDWCHDSQREVPRLLKILDMADAQLQNISLLAVNKYKQEPSGTYRELQLRYTPTFILFDGDKELGRVVERPQISLSEDLAALVK